MTVSRVVNGDPRVKASTRERVQQAIEELHYYPNAAARALNSKRTMTVGLILPKIDYVLSEPYFSQLIYQIEQAISPYNYDILVVSGLHQNGKDLTRLYKQKKVDGLIIVGSEINDQRLIAISDNRIPAVLIHGRSELPGLSFVDVDNYKIIEFFVNHLSSLGHRRLGFITGDLTVVNAYHRLQAYKKALKDRSLPLDKTLICTGNWSAGSGYDAFLHFYGLSELPTAVISSNDHMAIGFLKAANEHQIAIPQDISLVGIDDIEMAQFTVPTLTTMRQPMEALASQAVDFLMESIKSEASERFSSILEAELVLRNSCAPARSS